MLAYLKGTAVIIPPCFIWTRSCLSSRCWMLRIVVSSRIRSLINSMPTKCHMAATSIRSTSACHGTTVFLLATVRNSSRFVRFWRCSARHQQTRAAFLPIFSTFMCLLGYNSGNQVDWFLIAQPCLGAFAKHYTFERVFCCLICLSAGLITD